MVTNVGEGRDADGREAERKEELRPVLHSGQGARRGRGEVDAIVGVRALDGAQAVQGSSGGIAGDRDEPPCRQAQDARAAGDRPARHLASACGVERLRADGAREVARAGNSGLSRWGAKLLDAPHEDDDLRAGWAAVAMRSAIGGGGAGGRPSTYEFRIDGEAFHVRVRDGEEGDGVEARQGSAPNPDLVVIGDAESFLAVASGRLGPEEAVQSGALRAEGGREEDREALLAWCQSLVGPTAA